MSYFFTIRLLRPLLICFVFCTGAERNKVTRHNVNDSNKSGTAYPVTLKDASGFSVTVKKEPRRIISLIPSTTEMLFALGLGDRVVGVSNHDNYPEEAMTRTRVGAMKVNAEIVLSLNPDIIVGDKRMSSGAVDELRQLGLTVFITGGEQIDEVQKDIHTFGKLFNCIPEAKNVIERMNGEREKVLSRIQAIPDSTKVKVFIEHSPSLYTTGRGTFMHEIITLAGGTNIAGKIDGWGRMTEEEVLQANPDVILYLTGGNRKTKLRELMLARKAWKNISAIKANRLYGIDKDIVSRPGPRLTKGLMSVAGVLYPELFRDDSNK